MNLQPVVVHLLGKQDGGGCALPVALIKVSGERRLQSAIWLVCWGAYSVTGMTSCFKMSV